MQRSISHFAVSLYFMIFNYLFIIIQSLSGSQLATAFAWIFIRNLLRRYVYQFLFDWCDWSDFMFSLKRRQYIIIFNLFLFLNGLIGPFIVKYWSSLSPLLIFSSLTGRLLLQFPLINFIIDALFLLSRPHEDLLLRVYLLHFPLILPNKLPSRMLIFIMNFCFNFNRS